MASKTFTLTEEKKDLLIKVLLGIIAIGILIICIILGVYLFRNGGIYGCGPPVLDPNGFSNWTNGAEYVALGCFGEHATRRDKFLLSQCIDSEWKPEPPDCIALPLHLVCTIDEKGLAGTLHMWQRRAEDPLQIYGSVSTSEIDKTKKVFSEDFILSRTTCTTSYDFNITVPSDNHNETIHNSTTHDALEIQFNTKKLVAYKPVDLRVTMIFIDPQTTATLVSATQGDVSVVMPKPIIDPSTDWTLDGNKNENNNKTTMK